MYSKLLAQAGLLNKIGFIPYNFKDSQGLDQVSNQLIDLTNRITHSNQGIIYANQVHGKTVSQVDQIELDSNQVYRREASDGLMTSRQGLALTVKFADCTPIIIYDPLKRVQAVVHSGWRSTKERISQIAIQQLQTVYQSKLSDLLIYIGPTIDQANYEVGPEVYQAFEAFNQRDQFFTPASQTGKYLMSMQKANECILLEAGIQEDQMEVANLSTYTDLRLHSARRQGANYGLNAMVTVLT